MFNSDPYEVGIMHNSDAIGVTAKEVLHAIVQLADNKASGLDHITAEHLKHASPNVAVLLAKYFTLMSHGLLPHYAFCHSATNH